MKKILIASTALVAAGMITAGSASASEKIKLNLGGFSKWWVVGAWQDDSYQADTAAGGTGIDYANVDVKGDNEVFFGGSTTLDNGMKVGIDIQLEAGGHADSTNDTIDESYVWIQGGFGKFIVGTENNGVYLLHVTAPDAAANWNDGGVMTSGAAIQNPANVALPGLVNGCLSTLACTGIDAEKITYVAPTFYGLTLGASFVPNAASEDNRNATQDVAMYGVGALYSNTFGGVGVKVSGGFAMADTGTNFDTQYEWSTGVNLSYAGFTLGSSYRGIIDNFASSNTNGTAAPTANADGRIWDIGLQYASGPYAISLAYLNSEVEGLVANTDKDTITAYQLSGKYNLGAGVDVLASVGHIEYDDESAKGATGDVNHNEGWTVMTGLSLSF